MSDDTRSATDEQLRTLCREVTALVKSLPGPVRRLAVRTADHAVEIEWPISDAAALVPVASAEPLALVSRPLESALDKTPAANADASAYVVRAPLVGTFYRAPQPDADPFVSVSDFVEAGQTLAVVEAMKLLNHINAEVAGRVVEICVGDGEPVEFDQPLIRILPLGDDEAA
jgi:acetyl-CoA carboxylase biotin carboxyl carrier protein